MGLCYNPAYRHGLYYDEKVGFLRHLFPLRHGLVLDSKSGINC